MQQYRFNFPLFIGLIVGTLVCSGAVYGLWRFQIARKSDWLLSEAEKAQQADDFKEAARSYQQYLSIQPKDDSVRLKLAMVYADVTKSNDITFADLAAAIDSIENTLRISTIAGKPEAKQLRRRLVELFGRPGVNRYPDALEHLGVLLESDPSDPELQAMRAANLARAGNFDEAVRLSYKLIGYDPQADEFDTTKAVAPKNVEVYASLAATLRSRQDKPDLADRVMDQLVEANPQSAEAHLALGRYQTSLGNADEGRAEIEEAYELAPKDANVLIAMAELAANDEDLDKSLEYLEAGQKLFPKDIRFYSISANMLLQKDEYEKAIARIDEGVKEVGTNDKIQLMFAKADLQLAKRDIDATRKTIKEAQAVSTNINPAFLDLFDARILMQENKWNQAKETLSKLRPKFAEITGGPTVELDYYLGMCYENLRQPDMAIEYYNSVLQHNSKHPPALAGKERAMAMAGLASDAGKDDPFSKAYAEEMKKPKAERNWKALEEILATIGKEKKWDELNTNVKLAQVKIMAEDYESARKLLVAAQKIAPQNFVVRKMLIQVVQLDPKLGPDRALELYERTVKEVGDTPQMRLIKADIIIAKHAGQANKEELKSDLAELFAGIDAWTPEQKGELWSGMAGRYLALAMNAEARQYLTLAADALPHQLPIAITMFQLALEANDDAAMKDAQDRIVKIVGSTSDNNWLYTEAKRRLSLIRRGQLDQSALPEIRILVNRALEQRPDWHELYVVNGELETQAGNLVKAIEHYDRAQELGRPAPMYTAQHIKLLWLANRVKEAGELLERIPEASRFTLLGQLYPQILFRTNRVEEALTQAKTVVDANPDNAQGHYLYSQLLAESARVPKLTEDQRKAALGDAIKQMRRAVELQPEFPEAWLVLISYYAQLNDLEQAQSVLREAQLALSGDNLQIFLAKGYEAIRRGFDAETMYRAVYEAKPDDIARAQQLAAFYLGNVYQLPDRNAKATPLINKILRAGAEKKLQPGDAMLLWARRMGAKLLAETGDYQKLLKAENLLASNSQDGQLPVEDKLVMAEILANRPEPRSRKVAIQLLEEVAETQQLSERGEIVLGELYYATNQDDWGKYSRQMKKAIARFPDSVLPRAAYVKNLIKRTDKQSLDEATTQVTNMRRINPKYVGTFEYTVRLADKLGKQQAARAELLRSVPDLSKAKSLAPTDVQMLNLLANLLIELEDLDSAEKIYRDMAAIDPNQILAYANFLGMHRSVDQCFAKLNEVYTPERIPALLQVALVVVRKQRQEIGDKFDAQVQTWLDTGLRENPESIPLLMDQADFYDLQRRYKESAAVYRKLRERKDLVGIRRAIVLNNFAFLLALDSSAAKDIDPLKLVDEAISIMGPNSDILDTRAVVYISRKDYQQAIDDLELSVTDSPTASKYFHKAQAHLLAGENRAAVEAWEKAETLGLNHDAVNLMEIPRFDELKAKIDQIRGASVTQAEGRRRAG